MEIKYVDKYDNFDSGLENEIIEIKDYGTEVYVEAIIKADSFLQAADRFFEEFYKEKEHSRCILCLDFENFKTYVSNLIEKKMNTRRNHFRRFGYSWQMEIIGDNNYYINFCYRLFQNKYTLDLDEAITKYSSSIMK